jgi:hypothetical protein
MWSLSLWNWFAGGIWKSLETQARESLGRCKQNLMRESGGSSGDQNGNRNADSEGQTRKVSDGKEDSIGN